jgi:hypothetical protein
VVGHGGGVEGGEPQRVDAEQLEVAEPVPDAVEVTDTVPVGVREGTDIDLVTGRVVPPVGGGTVSRGVPGSTHS